MSLLITNLLLLLSLILFADIDECALSQPCQNVCTNLAGSFKCYCSYGLIGDGAAFHHKDQATSWSGSIHFTLGILVLAPAMASAWVALIQKGKKLSNHRRNIFEQNGGNLLMKKVSKLKEHDKKQIRVYTANEMRKATNNYNNKILYKCMTGTCYLARLPDVENTEPEVVIMSIPKVPESQIKHFVDRLIFLSQPHENLVKIIGCCLETDPLLVYEHHGGGISLFKCIHDKDLVLQFSLKKRVKAAAGAARALVYLHSQTSCRSIVQGNVSSANIILDDSSEAKLFYNAASNLIPQDISSSEQNYVHTPLVLSRSRLFFWQRPCRLNQKSDDVYSFGSVLKEVLIGWKATNPAEQQMANEINMLAERCSSENPKERPTMKEVKGKLNMLMQMS